MISSASAEYLATSASTRQPTEQVESLDGCVERAGWEPRGPAVRFLRRQDVDALCAQLDRVGDRRVVDHAAVDQAGLTGRNRGEDPRVRRRRSDRLHRRPVGEGQLASLDQVKRRQMEWDSRMGEVLKLDVLRLSRRSSRSGTR